MSEKLSEILKSRGYVYQTSSESLEEITDGEKRTVYLGADPTADSIHVGNLAAYMLLRRFAEAGHKVILLFGGGTGKIGDPKPDVERPLVPPEEIKRRVEKIKGQVEKLFGGTEVIAVDNATWLGELNLIEFLRDIGKHFTVNSLMKKEAIAVRLDSEEGISYTEFAYPLLQAYDFLHLHREMGCNVQIGGSDQWGNITAGVELIRRKEGKEVYALTLPLIIDKATGKKFGKSEGNAVWLDPEKTSPFAFYQFWLNASDESVEDYLKIFTLLPLEEIADIMRDQQNNPASRVAQLELANAVTELVHGHTVKDVLQRVRRITQALFSDEGLSGLTGEDIELIKTDAPSFTVAIGQELVDVLVDSGLAGSKREAREFIENGAVSLNGGKVLDAAQKVMEEDFTVAPVALLKRGKRNACVLIKA